VGAEPFGCTVAIAQFARRRENEGVIVTERLVEKLYAMGMVSVPMI